VFTGGRSNSKLKGSFLTRGAFGVLVPGGPFDILTPVDGPSRLLLSYRPGRGDYAVAYHRKPGVTQLFSAVLDESSGSLVEQEPRDPSDRPDIAGGLDSNDKHWLFHEAEDGAKSRFYLFESPYSILRYCVSTYRLNPRGEIVIRPLHRNRACSNSNCVNVSVEIVDLRSSRGATAPPAVDC